MLGINVLPDNIHLICSLLAHIIRRCLGPYNAGFLTGIPSGKPVRDTSVPIFLYGIFDFGLLLTSAVKEINRKTYQRLVHSYQPQKRAIMGLGMLYILQTLMAKQQPCSM